jgi:hypothetical protein
MADPTPRYPSRRRSDSDSSAKPTPRGLPVESVADHLDTPTLRPLNGKTTEIPARKVPPPLPARSRSSGDSTLRSSGRKSRSAKHNRLFLFELVTVVASAFVAIAAVAYWISLPSANTSSPTDGQTVDTHSPSSLPVNPHVETVPIGAVDPTGASEIAGHPEPAPSELASIPSHVPSRFPDAESPSPEIVHENPANPPIDEPDQTADTELANEVNDGSQDSANHAQLSPDGLIARSLSLLQANQRKEAMVQLKRASHLFPADPRPDFYVAVLYLSSPSSEPKDAKSKIESAESHFNKSFNRTAEGSQERLAVANNLAIVEVKLRKFAAARNYFSIPTKNELCPLEVNHNLRRLMKHSKLFDIKGDELKRLNSLKSADSDLISGAGWLFLSLDQKEQTLLECEAFFPGGNLDDKSCVGCNGCAKLICIPCRGTGKVAVLASASERRDIGFGATATLNSVGTTNVGCSKCGGVGRIDCWRCQDGRDPEARR